MPRMGDDDLSRFLRQPYIGVLATLRRGGLPYTVPVWWLWHEEAFWLTGTTVRVWCRQLMADPRASLCVEAREGHIGVDGRVGVHRAEEFDIWPTTSLLVDKYVGRGDPANSAAAAAFLDNMRTEPRMLFSLRPQDRRNAVRAIDMTVYQGKRAERL